MYYGTFIINLIKQQDISYFYKDYSDDRTYNCMLHYSELVYFNKIELDLHISKWNITRLNGNVCNDGTQQIIHDNSQLSAT